MSPVKSTLLLFWLVWGTAVAQAQNCLDTLSFKLESASGEALFAATVYLPGLQNGSTSSIDGTVSIPLSHRSEVGFGEHSERPARSESSTENAATAREASASKTGVFPLRVQIEALGYPTLDTVFQACPGSVIRLKAEAIELEEVVVSGNLSPVLRKDSPVAVQVLTRNFLELNPRPSLFESLQFVNGVRPQVNCAVCQAGDIHINGLEGPYTMVTIDGAPIMGGLASVYGLMGIPSAMIERVEVVKGPASTLYGSEAIGGLINVITRNADRAPALSLDMLSTGSGEITADIGISSKIGGHVNSLTGMHGYFFDRLIDQNSDGFTDMAPTQRLSVFQKLDFKTGRLAGLTWMGRAMLDERWGGQLNWEPIHRGTEIVYGEAIDTRRVETMLNYQPVGLPALNIQLSASHHDQRSDYGSTPYNARQDIAFAMLTYRQRWKRQELLYGLAARYTFYDDDSPATEDAEDGSNRPDKVILPGLFVQHELSRGRARVMTGLRYDYDERHGSIFTPRLALKLPAGEASSLRVNLGSGYRVVNLFTEDHAALSGAREVIIAESLRPERSYSGNLQYEKRYLLSGQRSLSWQLTGWYTWFLNRILPDYDTDPRQIRYANLDGYSIS